MSTTYHIADIRNVALAGHGASGKTSLADALLFAAGATNRKGSVDDGTSVLDVDEEEKRRHFTIDCHLGHLAWEGKQVHLIDTPGYPDFIGSALRAGGRRERGGGGLRPVGDRGEYAPALPRSRPAGTGPVRRRHQDGRRERRLPLRSRRDPRVVRHPVRPVQRPDRPGPELLGHRRRDPVPRGGPRRVPRGADRGVPDGRRADRRARRGADDAVPRGRIDRARRSCARPPTTRSPRASSSRCSASAPARTWVSASCSS